MTCASCASRIERTAEPAGRRERVRQLRHRAGGRRVRPGTRSLRPRSSRRSRRSDTRPACPLEAAASRRARCRVRPPAPADRLRRVALGARPAAGGDSRVPVHLLAVARARACDTGRPLGGLAVPPRRLEEPSPRRGDDGHADLLGTLAAWGWSVVALFFLDAGEAGMTMPFRLAARAFGRDRPALSRGGRRSSSSSSSPAGTSRLARSAVPALRCVRSPELGAKEAAILDDDGTERLVPIDQLVGRPALRRSARREDRHRRGGRRRAVGGRPVAAHGRERAGRGG